MSDKGNRDPVDQDRSVDSYCENCGDPYDMPPAGDPRFAEACRSWRPCPNPSSGRPMVDCGIGGHMYTERKPRCN